MAGRWLLLGGLALLLIAGALWLPGPSHYESPPQITAAPPDTSPILLRWRVGTSQQYRVQTDSSMQMNAAVSTQSMRVRMRCILELMTLEAGTDEALVGMRLSSVELRISGNTDPETNQALAVPFRVRFTSAGMPKTFEFPAGVTAQNRSILENLVRMFQVTMDKGDVWVAREANASGSYEAAYKRMSPTQVEKIKRHFSALPSASLLAGAEIASTEAFRLDPQRDWLAAMTVDETLRSTGQGGPGIKITNHAMLELQSVAHAAATADTWRFAAAAPPPVTASLKSSTPNISADEARRRIQDAVTALNAATEGRLTWVHSLRDLLRVNDAMPAVLLEALKTQQLSDRTRADLYLAFQLAGTKSAQAALVSVIADSTWSTRDDLRAIVALGGVQRPGPETLTALWDKAQSMQSSDEGERLASAATYALGNLGNAMKTANDPDYSSLRANLLSNALSGANTGQRTNFVYAVGNTRDASMAREIVPLLDDSQPAIRRAAALSLEMLGTDSVAGELMSHLKQESSSAVRGAIAEALVSWSAPTSTDMASIRNSIRTEPDENTRFNMARILGENLATFPENRPALLSLLRTEQSKRIRQTIANTLAAPR